MTQANNPPRWIAPDPAGRYEERFWDGTGWTHHVANHGHATIDYTEWRPAADEHNIPRPSGGVASASTPLGIALMKQAELPPPVTVGLRPDAGWRRLKGLRTTLVALLVCNFITSMGVMLAVYQRLSLIDDAGGDPRALNLSQARDSDATIASVALVYLLLSAAVGIVWIIWQWRCAKNVRALEIEGSKWGPGWSIGGWFVPIANIFIPFKIMQDLWRASAPGLKPGDTLRSQFGSPLIWAWWLLFLFSGVITQAFGTGGGTTLDSIRDTNNRMLLGFGLGLLSTVLAITIVVQLTQRFEDRRDEALGLAVAV
ncbi:MAG: DUF4328 domain-containing protein [Acidimicrobiia bacterium]